MQWWERHAGAIEAIAAVVMAIVAVAALIGVKVQLDSADAVQRAQSARDAYRAHLTLAVEHPQFASPENGCALIASSGVGAYTAFVDHLLYSAEQMLVTSGGWEPSFDALLSAHSDYLCSDLRPRGETDETRTLLSRFHAEQCPATPSC